MKNVDQNKIVIPIIPDNTNFWFVRAGANAIYFDDFYLNNYIGVETFGVQKQEMPEGASIDEKSTIAKYKKPIQKTLQEVKTKELKKIYPSDSPEDQQKLDEAIKKEKRSVSISAGKKANTLFKFWHLMKSNDFVLTPGYHSNILLLGIILDEPNYSVSHSQFTNEEGETLEYNVSPYDGKKIFWIKKIKFEDIPDSTRFIKHGNGAIFDITTSKTDLLALLFPIYVHQEKIYTRLNVASQEHHTSKQIYRLQGIIEHTKVDELGDYVQKTKIASPGYVLLETSVANSDSILNILHVFGIGGFASIMAFSACKVIKYLAPAINSRFSNGAKYDRERKKIAAAKEQQELKQMKDNTAHTQKMNKLEEEQLELDNEHKRLENKKLSQTFNHEKQEETLVTKEQAETNFERISQEDKEEGPKLAKELQIELGTTVLDKPSSPNDPKP